MQMHSCKFLLVFLFLLVIFIMLKRMPRPAATLPPPLQSVSQFVWQPLALPPTHHLVHLVQ